jgi:hypothetical protein
MRPRALPVCLQQQFQSLEMKMAKAVEFALMEQSW